MTEKPQQNRQTKQGDGAHSNKKSMQSDECHQTAMWNKNRVIPDRCNPPEEEAIRNNLDNLHFTKLKTSVTRVTN